VSTGKWYFEYLINNTGGGGAGVGVANYDHANNLYSLERNYQYSGNKSNGTSTSYGASYTSGSVIGVALDMDTGSLTFYKNGVSQGVAFTDLLTLGSVSIFGSGDNSSNFTINAGQRPFAYTAPSGFKALCTTNLPEPTIADGSQYFQVIKYTGNGTTQTLPNINSEPSSELNFSPDLVWTKARSFAENNNVFDTVREATKLLLPDRTNPEQTISGITAFNSDGYTVGSHISCNSNGETYVSWNWDAGGTTDPSNQAGSITSQVRANVSAGFSVVTFTGPASAGFGSVGHGLNAKPKFIICKDRSNARNWGVYHESVVTTDNKVLILNSTSAVFNSGTPTWDVSEINSTIFTPYFRDDFGASYNANNVAYCFTPVEGYSAFGSYTGNGSTDGPMIATMFRPRWILIKNSSATADWSLFDTARDSYNQALTLLAPNLSAADNVLGSGLDILSNGFKLRRDASPAINASSNTFVYAAFAESPFQYSRAR
jgi:hypothetical protein